MIGGGGAKYAPYWKDVRAESMAIRLIAEDLRILRDLPPGKGPGLDGFREDIVRNCKRYLKAIKHLLN